MPRTPRVERTCLICNDTFDGTLKATRCKPCKDKGLKVPSNTQRRRAKDPRPGGIPKNRACIECGDKFEPRSLDHRFCPICTDMLGFDPPNLTGHLNSFDIDKLGEEDDRGLVVDQLTNLERAVVAQINYDPASNPTPKGYQRMTQRTKETPLGIIWVQICAADGAASSIMSITDTPKNLTEDGKVTLLTTFFRLRAKGYHPAVIARLCPIAILKQAAQEALTDLPKVTDPEPQDLHDWDQIVARSQLGLL